MTPAEIKRSLSSKDWCAKLDEYQGKLVQAHAMVCTHQANANPEVTLRLQGLLESRLVQSFLEKKGKGEWELKKPAEVCHAFVESLSSHVGVSIPSPWEAEVQALKVKPNKAAKNIAAPSSFLE